MTLPNDSATFFNLFTNHAGDNDYNDFYQIGYQKTLLDVVFYNVFDN